MRFATWNIMHGEHVSPAGFTDPMRSLAAAISAIDADFIGLQEVDYFHPRTDSVNQAGFAASEGTFPYWALAPAFTFHGSRIRNVSSHNPALQTNAHHRITPAYGIAILSKHPVAEWLYKKLPTALWGGFITMPIDGKPTRFFAKDHSRVALAARFENFILINTHLSFVSFFARIQFIAVKRWASKLEKRYNLPVVLMGDFNLPKISGPWKSTMAGFTFPVWAPDCQIDYILTRSGESNAGVIEGFETSDHAALIVELDI